LSQLNRVNLRVVPETRIDKLVEWIPNAEQGFRLIFAARSPQFDMEG
jgi:hypothetical protein